MGEKTKTGKALKNRVGAKNLGIPLVVYIM